MRTLSIVLFVLLTTGCRRTDPSIAAAWSVQAISTDSGLAAHRIIPTRPWWNLGPPPENWAEIRTRPDGTRLVLLSSSTRFLKIKGNSVDEPIAVDVKGEPRRRYRALRLVGGQQWLCSPAMTRYVVEHLRSGRAVSIFRESNDLLCFLEAGGFSECWDQLTENGFGLDPAADLFSPN